MMKAVKDKKSGKLKFKLFKKGAKADAKEGKKENC